MMKNNNWEPNVVENLRIGEEDTSLKNFFKISRTKKYRNMKSKTANIKDRAIWKKYIIPPHNVSFLLWCI